MFDNVVSNVDEDRNVNRVLHNVGNCLDVEGMYF